MKLIDNLQVYDLAESIAASGYPMRTETNRELEDIRKAIKKGTFGEDEKTKSIFSGKSVQEKFPGKFFERKKKSANIVLLRHSLRHF